MRNQRRGIFKKGHKKLGGRKKGTPNRLNQDLIEAIKGAAGEVGSDGKGKGGVGGYLKMLAGDKVPHFVGLFRQAVQKQRPPTEPENQVVYSTDQGFRQALLDGGLHPTLLPPPPRDLSESPPINGDLKLPKPPPGWGWALCKTNQSAEADEEQPDSSARSELGAEEPAELEKEQPDPTAHVNAEENDRSREIKAPDAPPYGTPWNPAPGWRWEYAPYTKSWFAKPTKSGLG